MTPDEVLKALAKAGARRQKADIEAAAADAEEKRLIAEGWRAGVHPSDMETATGRSGAHIRKFRPEDVPPLRTGGGYALKHAPKKRTRRSK